MTVRQQIFETLKSDLLKIRTTNGYSHDIKKVFPVLRSLDDLNEFPAVCIVLGEELINPEFEDRNISSNIFRLVILTHIETGYDSESDGLFTTDAEEWIEDYQKFISGDDINICSALMLVPGVQNVFISRTEPYADWRENKQTLELIVTVEYVSTN